ncbi:LIM homeobox transcription factor 1-beta-like isoform X1 [Aphis craccivora]|uniref:LIM homeobox transcription factor 1-beta-like isoform X1 n=1 Tax=Aphis craccivora TaxID=307492 RepID=A0A6G0ZAH3_APHCR|nr:LIM homeobox transcription factor 1-beta-like isoform X1 [Aphis craccivora]
MKTALGVVKLKMEPIYGDDPSESAVVSTVCAKCECTIVDRYIMRVSGRSYHERCLKCTTCALKLDRSCFVWNAKLYCRQDYDNSQANICDSLTQIDVWLMDLTLALRTALVLSPEAHEYNLSYNPVKQLDFGRIFVSSC